MDNRKLKYFEYAGFVDRGLSEKQTIHHHDAFETPNGYALIIASSDIADNKPDYAAITVERVKYYLDNEVPDKPSQAVYNAILYANGYIFEKQRDQENRKPVAVSCLCVLVKDQEVYYSWAGQACLFLFNGKKFIPLAHSRDSKDEGDSSTEKGTGDFMGIRKMISPGKPNVPFKPLDNDMLLMGTQPVCQYLKEKEARKVLLDSMPVQTKVMRLVNIIGGCGNDGPVALQLLSFYNLQNTSRSFSVADDAPSLPLASEKDPVRNNTGKNRWIKIIAIVAAILIIGYMMYDLFFFSPGPSPQRIKSTVMETEQDTAEQTETPAVQQEAVDFPDDIAYTVRNGDTWSSIYSQFQVCSWFIRNHPPNSSSFSASEELVTGTPLMIPVKYSADPSLNPGFYKEFTLDKVGNSCQNAGPEFIESFRERLNN